MNYDWEILREQKALVVHLAGEAQENERFLLDGLLSLMDGIQDRAVALGFATEAEVFGITDDEGEVK
jgi:hypothetical protein